MTVWIKSSQYQFESIDNKIKPVFQILFSSSSHYPHLAPQSHYPDCPLPLQIPRPFLPLSLPPLPLPLPLPPPLLNLHHHLQLFHLNHSDQRSEEPSVRYSAQCIWMKRENILLAGLVIGTCMQCCVSHSEMEPELVFYLCDLIFLLTPYTPVPTHCIVKWYFKRFHLLF